MLEAYEKHESDRAKEGIDPKPLDAEQVSQLVELLKLSLLSKKQSLCLLRMLKLTTP